MIQKTIKKHLRPISLLAFFLNSCAHYYYMPTSQNVPLFKEKNEYRLSLSSNGSTEIKSTEVQTAYSVTKNIALMSNFMLAKGGTLSQNNWGKGHYIDGAIGYYNPLNKFAVFEIYGGFGTSKQHHQYESTYYGYGGSSDLSFTKIFVQPSIGFTYNAFDIALSSRLCNVSFQHINNFIDSRNSEYNYLDSISQNRRSFVSETALTMRTGWKYVKLQMQFGFLRNLTNSNLRFMKSYVSVGLYLNISKRFKKRQAQ